MAEIAYEKISLVVGDRNRDLRFAVAALLKDRGFPNPVHSDTLSIIEQELSSDAVDILVCDTNLIGGDVCELVKRIRHHDVGTNPFVAIILMIDEPSAEVVKRVIGSGADDVIVKPVTAGQILSRIEALTRKRKKFLVTSDYIGPDRRSDEQRVQDDKKGTVKAIEIPNALNAKGLGDGNTIALQAEIDNIASLVNEQKMESHADEIFDLVSKISSQYEKKMTNDDTVNNVGKLVYVSEDIARRLENSRYAHVGELCLSMCDLAGRINKSPLNPDPTDAMLLKHLGNAIKAAFMADVNDIAVVHQITESMLKLQQAR